MDILETGRLRLRAMEEGDLDRFEAMFNTAFVTQYLCMDPMCRDECLAYIRRMMEGEQDLAVALRETDALIGKIHLDRDNQRFGVKSVSLAYWLGEAYTGQGYMTEALEAVLAYLFAAGYDVVAAEVLRPNTASARLLHRLGFTLEGSVRMALDWHGVVYDNLLFSMTRADYGTRAPR